MDTYEKSIGLKTIWLTIIRRFKIILLFFIPIVLVSFLGTKKVFKTSYQASMSIKMGGATISQDNHGKLMNFVTSDDTKAKVSENLAKKENPINIEASAINLSYTTWKSGITSISVSFKSSNKTVATEVMKELKTYVSDPANYADAAKYQFNEPSTQTISKQKKYFLILAVLGAVVSFGLAFYDEISSDEVYDAKDVKAFGGDAFEIDTKYSM